MLVYFVTDEPTKLPAIRAMLEPQHAVVPWVLDGDGTGIRSHGVLMVDIDLRQMTRVDQARFILEQLAIIPEKLFVVHNLSRSMVAQAYARPRSFHAPRKPFSRSRRSKRRKRRRKMALQIRRRRWTKVWQPSLRCFRMCAVASP
jgi:hypothetical protein